MSTSEFNPSIETQLVHAGFERSHFGETSEPLYLTQGFVYKSAEAAEARFNGDDPGFVYSRYANPTNDIFEKRICAMEQALKAGDHIVAARALFGSCRWIVETLLPQYGVESTLVDGRNLDNWQQAMQANTKVCFLESPTNPTLELVDIAGVAEIAHANGARLVVDNVFATPLLQKPLTLGADIVVYSATKHIDGQGRCLGGVVLSSKDWIDEYLHDYFRHTGPNLSPFNAWTLTKGLETLPLRVEKQSKNAALVADFLADHTAVSKVIYPGRKDHPQADVARKQMLGGSTLVAIELKGDKASAFAFENALRIFRISNNLGDAKSLITHPATTTHKNLAEEDRLELGINEGTVRISLGLENSDDLLNDLDQALKYA